MENKCAYFQTNLLIYCVFTQYWYWCIGVLTPISAVRKFSCAFNQRLFIPLFCKWFFPRKPNVGIRYFDTTISFNGSSIFQGTTKHRYVSGNVDLIDGASFKFPVISVSRVKDASSFAQYIFHKHGKFPFPDLFIIKHLHNLSNILITVQMIRWRKSRSYE